MTRAASLALLAALASGCSDSTTRTTTPEVEAETATESATETGTETATDVPAEPLPAGAQGAWWTWSESAPPEQNPVLDRTGEHCAVGQPDDVWFLAGTYGGAAQRDCAVPAGRALVLPAVNSVMRSAEDCAAFMSEARGEITLDGASVPLETIRGELIVIDTPQGEVQGIGCGLWATIDGLSDGRHRVTISGDSGSLRVRVSYELRVG